MFGKKKVKPEEQEIINQIEQLSPRESLSYQLKELFGGELAIVELNPKYPDKGQRKYRMSLEQLVDGKPSGKRQYLLGNDKPEKIADWLYSKMIR